MQKRLITTLALVFLVSQLVSGANRFNIHSVSLFGYEPVSRTDYKVTGSGISVAQELYFSWGSIFNIGAGGRYLFPVDTENEETLSFIPVYAALKIFLPVDSVPLYAKAAAGYNFVNGNDAANLNKDSLTGGLYYSLGGGVDLPFYYSDSIRFSFVFDMGWSSYKINYKDGGNEKDLGYMTMDMLMGLGIRL